MSAGAQTVRVDLGSGSRAMARGAAVNLGGAAVAFALTFLFRFVVTHAVPVGDFGRFQVATSVVALAQIPALLGLDTGVIRYVAMAAARDDERSARAAAQTALALAALGSLVACGILLGTADQLADGFFNKPQSADLIRLVALSIPGVILGRIALASIQGFGVMGYASLMGSVKVVMNLVAALPLLAAGLDAEALAIAALVTAYGAMVLSFVFLLRVHPGVLRPARGAWLPGRILRFSLPQTFTAMLLFAILWTDTLLVARYGTAADVAVYAIAAGMLQPANMVSTSIGQMFAPRVAAEDARGDRRVLQTMLKRVTYWNTATSLPLYAALMVLPVPLLALFGNAYEAGAWALVILSAGQLFNTAAGPLGQVINMSGRPYITATNNGLVAAINVAMCLYLVPRYGIVGAACSTATALTLVNLIKMVQVRLIFGMTSFRADSLRAGAAAAMAAGLAAAAAYLIPWPNAVLQVLVPGALLVSSYVALVLRLGLSDEDRELVQAVRGRLRRRLRRARR